MHRMPPFSTRPSAREALRWQQYSSSKPTLPSLSRKATKSSPRSRTRRGSQSGANPADQFVVFLGQHGILPATVRGFHGRLLASMVFHGRPLRLTAVPPTICAQSRIEGEGSVYRHSQIMVAVLLLAGVGLAQAARAQNSIKYGVIGQFTGPFAVTGEQYKQGLEAFLAQHGATAGERKIELVYRDTGGPNPAQAKRL